MSLPPRLSNIVTSALLLTLLTSCEALRPAEVCRNEDTLAAVKQILQQIALPDGDPPLVAEAFEELFRIELITFEGYDRQTRRVSCSARLATADGRPTPFTYTRIPEVGAKQYIYSVRLGEDATAAFSLSYRLGRRYRELETQTIAPSAISTPAPASDLPPQPPAKAGDVEGFPLGHRSAGALLTKLDNVDTAAAMMTGRMTRESARPFCAYPSATSNDIERCINEQISNNPGELIASANCQTRELLTSGGSPFRREQGGWRNDQTNEIVADDDPPASGIFVIQTQFETLCPKAARALK